MTIYQNFSTKNNNFKLVGPPSSPGPWTRHVSIESQKGRKCFEFSWDKKGALYFYIGFVIGDHSLSYYHFYNDPYFVEDNYPIYSEVKRRAIGIDSLGEDVMVCGNSYEKSIIVVNKNTQYKYVETSQGTSGRMHIRMGQGKSSNSVDYLHLKYRQSNFTNRMPLGFNAWEYSMKTVVLQNKRILNMTLLLIFVCVCS